LSALLESLPQAPSTKTMLATLGGASSDKPFHMTDGEYEFFIWPIADDIADTPLDLYHAK
jgi:hypothetical protein